MKTTYFGEGLSHALAVLVWAGNRLVTRIADLPDVIYVWQYRARSRHQLMTMDHRLLKDMGLSRYDALREGGKPFWRR